MSFPLSYRIGQKWNGRIHRLVQPTGHSNLHCPPSPKRKPCDSLATQMWTREQNHIHQRAELSRRSSQTITRIHAICHINRTNRLIVKLQPHQCLTWIGYISIFNFQHLHPITAFFLQPQNRESIRLKVYRSMKMSTLTIHRIVMASEAKNTIVATIQRTILKRMNIRCPDHLIYGHAAMSACTERMAIARNTIRAINIRKDIGQHYKIGMVDQVAKLAPCHRIVHESHRATWGDVVPCPSKCYTYFHTNDSVQSNRLTNSNYAQWSVSREFGHWRWF